jgi:hypothetical protein
MSGNEKQCRVLASDSEIVIIVSTYHTNCGEMADQDSPEAVDTVVIALCEYIN